MEEFHRIPVIIVDKLIDSDSENFNDKNFEDTTLELLNDESNNLINPIELAKKYKEAGRKFYDLKKFDLSLDYFLKAKSILDIEISLKDNFDNEIAEKILERMILINNCIACYIERSEYEKAIEESRYLLSEIINKRKIMQDCQNLIAILEKIENKAKYRCSLSLMNYYKISNRKEKFNLNESFDLLKEIFDYYNELNIEPPNELLILNNQILNLLNENSDKTSNIDINSNSHTNKENSNYLKEYILSYKSNKSSENKYDSPIPAIDRMNCNSNIDFIKIWQNISKNDKFIDYYIIFGEFFLKIDRIFSKIELEDSTIEKIFERISVIVDEMNNLNLFNIELAFHLLNLVKKLISTHRFEFILSMISKSYNITEKLFCFAKNCGPEFKDEMEIFNKVLLSRKFSI